MRNRIWFELCQAKHNQRYCILLLAYRRRLLNLFTILILTFSGAGVMGWALWKEFPLIACIIISIIQLLRLLQPHLIPTEKQVDKLDSVVDFYFDYCNELEKIWMDYERDKCNDDEAQNSFYTLKASEKQINKSVSELIKMTNKKILIKAEQETREYLKNNFN